MEDSNSLINLGDISKPASTLIEKISDAIGGAFKPQQIRRVARAEAEAEIIRAKADIEVTDLQRRALEHFVAEEANKQANIEAIIQKALPQLNDQSSPEKMEDDWITNFFDKSRLISNEEMQILWARLLASEANQPGKFSRRAVNILASLDKSDAELFSRLCSFIVNLDNLVPLIHDTKVDIYASHSNLIPLIYSTEADIYINHGIDFSTVIHLENLGLIHHEGIGDYNRSRLCEYGYVSYFDKRLYIRFLNSSEPKLVLGKVLFTQIGQQLANVVSASPVEGFDIYLREKWKELEYETEPEETARNKP